MTMRGCVCVQATSQTRTNVGLRGIQDIYSPKLHSSMHVTNHVGSSVAIATRRNGITVALSSKSIMASEHNESEYSVA